MNVFAILVLAPNSGSSNSVLDGSPLFENGGGGVITEQINITDLEQETNMAFLMQVSHKWTNQHILEQEINMACRSVIIEQINLSDLEQETNMAFLMQVSHKWTNQHIWLRTRN